ncbi:hypothetical protein EDD21DRAFT_361392 [Dissophora ornata]|nr:hypothetical protein EDD21DRAFT_361392 [Dissophora ornata]
MSFNIEMRELTPRNELNPILELLKQYGRSIKQFDTNSTFTDNLARSLYDSTSIEGSQLTTLILNPKSLTSVGLELMGKIIGLSQNLESLQFFIDRLEIENEQQRVQRGLDRHWESWNGLALRRDGSDRPLSQLLLDFPSRRQLPQLHTLRLSCSVKQPVPQACANWVVAMISVPISLSMPLSSLGSSPQHTRNTYSHTNPQSWKPLKCIDLEGFQFEPKDWRAIIESMDFSELETLSLADSNFSVEQFGILVECVFSCSASEVPLMCVKMGSTAVFYESDVVKVLSLFTRLQEKVPLVHIDGLWQLFSQDENSHGV